MRIVPGGRLAIARRFNAGVGVNKEEVRSEERGVGRGITSGLVGGSNPSCGINFTLMPAAVYLLRTRTGRYYYRSTTDLARRLEQHGRGHTATTARIALGTRNGSLCGLSRGDIWQ